MPQIRGIQVPKEDMLRNYFINSNFDFWQRGASFSTPSSGAYTADRFCVEHDGTIGTFTLSQQSFTVGQVVVPNEPRYFCRWNQTAAGSGSTVRRIVQRIESVRTLAGKTISISFWAKADTARTVNLGVRQYFGSGGSPSAIVENPAVGSFSLTTSFQKFTVSYALPSISGKTLGTNNNDYLAIQWNLPINTTMTIDLAQVMINEGPVSSPHKTSDSIEEELAVCQRYFTKSANVATIVPSADGINSSAAFSTSSFNSGNAQSTLFNFPVEMRSAPIITVWDVNSTPTLNRISYSEGTGSRANGVLEPATKFVSTKYWFYQNGGIGSNSSGSGLLQYIADAELT